MTKTQQEYRQQQILLDKVRLFWIEGVLHNCLPGRAMIELRLEERSAAVQRPFSGVEAFPAASRQPLLAGTQATAVFEQMGAGRTLLILGEPGSGKTITLLKLAEALIERTAADLSQPIPVVFNLSSWASKEQSIANWLVERLSSHYQLPEKLGKTWIGNQNLLLLLDGLDEVKAELRNACVEALNQFIQTHGQTEIVICSRIRDYEALSSRLQLQRAICIRPLTFEQINQYLEQAGDRLQTLGPLLQQNEALQELAGSPLLLNLMTLAYQGIAITDLPEMQSIEERRRHLLDAYIDRMFSHQNAMRPDLKLKVKPKVLRWLNWLARQMIQNSQTVFFIEKIQPSWMDHSIQRLAYRLGTCVLGGWSLGLVSSLGLIFGLCVGPVAFLLIGLLLDLPIEFTVYELATDTINFTLPYWLLSGFGCALAFLEVQEIKTVEAPLWSWRNIKNKAREDVRKIPESKTVSNFLILMALALSLLLLARIDNGAFTSLIEVGMAFGGFAALFYAFVNGFSDPGLQIRAIPNHGIWASMRNAIKFTFIFFAISLLICVILTILPTETSKEFEIYKSLGLALAGTTIGSFLAAFFMPLIAFYSGGRACIQHFSLRVILFLNGSIPWNYAQFLDWASDRLFLRKVGGGYIFVHRPVMEHFAQLGRSKYRRDRQH